MRQLHLPLSGLLFSAGLLALAGPAGAQAYVTVGAGQKVFFSPSGQPFRAPATEAYPTPKWVTQADTDADGKISHEEFLADAMTFFAVLDADHNGYVNSPENTRYETRIAPEIQAVDPRIKQPKNRERARDYEMDANPNPYDGRYKKQIIGATQYGLIDEPQPVRAADSNLDFRVTAEEWTAASNQRFTILDTNEDGFLTPDEMPKTPTQIAGEAPPPEAKKGKKKLFGGD